MKLVFNIYLLHIFYLQYYLSCRTFLNESFPVEFNKTSPNDERAVLEIYPQLKTQETSPALTYFRKYQTGIRNN